MIARRLITTLAVGAAFAATAAWAAPKVALPDTTGWLHYETSNRGSVIEEMFIPHDVANQMKTADKYPYGTRIVLVEYENEGGQKGEVRRYIVMQKEKGWGADYPSDIRNGEWEYQAYHGDKTPFADHEDPVSRCLSCHKGASDTDYVFSTRALKNALR